jgi:hypothetical protein
MRVRAPGEPLAGCAAVLRESGFPSATVNHLQAKDGSDYRLVIVVEPQHADRIRQRSKFSDRMPDAASWADGLQFFRAHTPAFQRAVSTYSPHQKGEAPPQGTNGSAADKEDVKLVQEYWGFLQEHETPEDRKRALWTLEHDGNGHNRVIAASILSGFPQEDRVWWALMEAQRDSFHPVAATASQALTSMASFRSTPVDWSPAIPAIRALLGGTNVFTLDDTLDVLVRSGLEPALAPKLLGDGGGDLVLALAGAEHPAARQKARRFLVHLAGEDLGEDPAAWRRWVEALE